MPIQLIFVGLLFWFDLVRKYRSTQPDVCDINLRTNHDTKGVYGSNTNQPITHTDAKINSRADGLNGSPNTRLRPVSEASVIQECYKVLAAHGLVVLQRETLSGGRQLVIQKAGTNQAIRQFRTEDELVVYVLREFSSR